MKTIVIEKELLEEIKEVESSMKDLYTKGELSEVRYNEFKKLTRNLRIFLGVETK